MSENTIIIAFEAEGDSAVEDLDDFLNNHPDIPDDYLMFSDRDGFVNLIAPVSETSWTAYAQSYAEQDDSFPVQFVSPPVALTSLWQKGSVPITGDDRSISEMQELAVQWLIREADAFRQSFPDSDHIGVRGLTGVAEPTRVSRIAHVHVPESLQVEDMLANID